MLLTLNRLYKYFLSSKGGVCESIQPKSIFFFFALYLYQGLLIWYMHHAKHEYMLMTYAAPWIFRADAGRSFDKLPVGLDAYIVVVCV